MLIIEMSELENGAHNNQRFKGSLAKIPSGWFRVAEELEEEAWGYLPFINITEVTDSVITGVEQGTIPPPEPEPERPPTDTEVLNALLGVTEDE